MNALQALAAGGGQGTDLALLAILPLGLLILLVALFAGGGGKKQFTRRVARIKTNHEKHGTNPERISIARRAKKSSDIRILNYIIQRLLPRQDELRLRIERAGMGFSVGVYVLSSLLLGIVAAVGASMLWNWSLTTALPFGLAMGLAIPHFYLGMRINKRQARFVDLFPDAIDLMVRGIKAGLPIAESIKAAGDEIPDPVGIELRRVTDGVRVGRQMDDVLWESSRRMGLQEFNFFAIALSIQNETGGNLAETLNNLAEVLRGRRQLKRKIRALSSEAKASAYIIGSLPFIMTLLIYLTNSNYIVGLFMDPRGQAMVGFGLFMIAVGALVMYRMVKFEI